MTVLDDPDLTKTAKVLYAVLAQYADTDGRCIGGRYPGRKKMAVLLDVSEETVKRAKRELVDAKAIECHARYDESGAQLSDDIDLRPPGQGGGSDPGVKTAVTPGSNASSWGGQGGGAVDVGSQILPTKSGENLTDARGQCPDPPNNERVAVYCQCGQPAKYIVGAKQDPKTFDVIGGMNVCGSCYDRGVDWDIGT